MVSTLDARFAVRYAYPFDRFRSKGWASECFHLTERRTVNTTRSVRINTEKQREHIERKHPFRHNAESVMPPSNAAVPGDRSYRDVSFSSLDESDTTMESLQDLLTMMQVSATSEVSVDEVAKCLKQRFNLKDDNDSNIRGLAQFVMKLNLKDCVAASADSNSADAAGTKANDFQSETNTIEVSVETEPSIQPSDSRLKSANSSLRNRCTLSRTPNTSSIRGGNHGSMSPMRSRSPLTRAIRRSSSKVYDASAIPPQNPPQSCPPPVEATPVSNGSNATFMFSPPSTGTFDSFLSATDSPALSVGTPEIATPLVDDFAALTVDGNKTGVAKRRNKTEAPTPDLKAFPPPEQSTFQQTLKSPPLFKVNLKNTKKPGLGRLKRQQQPRQQSMPPSVQRQQNSDPPQIPFEQPASVFMPQSLPTSFAGAAVPNTTCFYDAGTPGADNSSLPSAIFSQQTPTSTSFIDSPMDVDVNVKFNLGSSPSAKRNSPGNRMRRNLQRKTPNQKPGSRDGADRSERNSNLDEVRQHAGTGGETGSSLAGEEVKTSTMRQEVVNRFTKPSVRKEEPNVDFSGRDAMVDAVRKEARDLYSQGDFTNSVRKYTFALATHTRAVTAAAACDDRRAVLLANRATALFMLGAYEATILGCQEATTFITNLGPSENGEVFLTVEGGPLLKATVYTRMGKAYVKKGALDEAARAFDRALEIIQTLFDSFRLNVENRSSLNQVQTDANNGKTEIARCREALDTMMKCGLRTPENAKSVSRIVNLRGLSSINSALSLAPGCEALLEMKLTVLASLNRWREVYLCCERIASDTVNLDGVFTDDLLRLCPLPNVPIAKYLAAGRSETETISKLSSKAIAEVALRLPPNLQPLYIHALRLEERCHQALNALNVLCDFVSAFVPDVAVSKIKWIVEEKKKLEGTIAAKEMGDDLFRTGDYSGAVDRYTICLRIDSADRPLEAGFAGGRLHAVLHCNRAAAYMAQLKYREAIADCTASLRIHSHYMKAMLRRSRCYVRLNRFDEAQSEYERYINLVETARGTGSGFENTPCLFDGPKDVNDSDFQAVKVELMDVKRAKINMENNKRREEEERKSRQNWYNEAFGQSKAGDAERRRQEWYSQQGQGSRRWDSFNGQGPNSHAGSSQKWQSSKNAGTSSQRSRWKHEGQDQQQRQESRNQEERKENVLGSPCSDKTICHYKVLQLSTNATDIEIKKAYKVAARKYHPDKNKESGATDMFRRVKLAYDVLIDPVEKREYDTHLRWNRRY